MKHLSFDDLFNLAQIASDVNTFNSDEIIMLNHLKECKKCYEQFCILLTLNDVTDNSILLSDNSECSYIETPSYSKRIFAALSIAFYSIKDTISAEMKKINDFEQMLIFEKSLSFATRGTNGHQSSIDKYEEIDNDQTYIAIDKERKRVYIQIDSQVLNTSEVNVYIIIDGKRKIELETRRVGTLITATYSLEGNNIELFIEEQ